jgi:hypothetical protein
MAAAQGYLREAERRHARTARLTAAHNADVLEQAAEHAARRVADTLGGGRQRAFPRCFRYGLGPPELAAYAAFVELLR